MLDQIDLTKSYRVTMTDYCYRNYKNYLKMLLYMNHFDETMSTLIAES